MSKNSIRVSFDLVGTERLAAGDHGEVRRARREADGHPVLAFTQGLPPILNAAAVAGGVGGMAVVAAGAGALTFRGASLQKARLAAARAEFLAPGSQGGA